MAFVVEDGTGLASATSYASVAEAKTYWDDSGFDYTGFSTDDIEKSLVKATRYMEARYRYVGCLEFPETQALSWPRTYAYDKEGRYQEDVPTRVKNACIEYAQISFTEDLIIVPTQDDRGQVVERLKEQVGPIETTVKYFGGVTRYKVFPFPDSIIEELTINTGNKVYRA